MDQSNWRRLPDPDAARDEPVECWARWEAKSPTAAHDLARSATPVESTPACVWAVPILAALAVLAWAMQCGPATPDPPPSDDAPQVANLE